MSLTGPPGQVPLPEAGVESLLNPGAWSIAPVWPALGPLAVRATLAGVGLAPLSREGALWALRRPSDLDLEKSGSRVPAVVI